MKNTNLIKAILGILTGIAGVLDATDVIPGIGELWAYIFAGLGIAVPRNQSRVKPE